MLVKENTVRINLSGQMHRSALVLPKQIKTASVHVHVNYTVPPLKELCLSFIYGAEGTPSTDWKRFLPDRDTRNVPRVLLDALEEGPITWCDYPECQRSIFTYAVVLVVPIAVTPKEYLASVDNLMLLYFCSDHCADQLKKYCGRVSGSMFVWLAERLRRCLRVDII